MNIVQGTRNRMGIARRGAIQMGVGGASLLLDSLSNVAAAYSFRKLRTAYAGSAVRVRRSSDNAEQDIGFVANGFDTASAASFIGGGSGYIAKWYDQSGNSRDLIQASALAQPLYVASVQNGKPAAYSDSNDTMESPAFSVSQPYWLFWTQKVNNDASFGGLGLDPTINLSFYNWNLTARTYSFYPGSGGLSGAPLPNPNAHAIHGILCNGASSKVRMNGTQTGTGSIAGHAATAVKLAGQNGVYFFDGWTDEIVLIGQDLSAGELSAFESNTMTHFGVS